MHSLDSQTLYMHCVNLKIPYHSQVPLILEGVKRFHTDLSIQSHFAKNYALTKDGWGFTKFITLNGG